MAILKPLWKPANTPLAGEIELGSVDFVALHRREFSGVVGVYLLRDEFGNVRYVGHTVRSVAQRLYRAHMMKQSLRYDWIVSVVPGDSARERALIEQFRPDCNIQHSIGARRRSLEYRMAKMLNQDWGWWKRLPDLRKRAG